MISNAEYSKLDIHVLLLCI